MTAADERDVLDADPREEKLPGWAKTQLGALRREVRHLRAEDARMSARLSEHVAAEAVSDTVLVDPLGGYHETPDRPLGDGAHVRFGDFFEVYYAPVDGGARALIVEGDYPLAVRPVNQDQVTVTRA